MHSTSSFASTDRYSLPAIVLHWLIAVLIGAAVVIGLVMTSIPGLTPMKLRYFSYHKWIGVTIFALVLLRILWRMVCPPPSLPRRMPGWERAIAHAVHGMLYLLMIAVPVSGYLYSSAAGLQVVLFGVLPLPTLIGPDHGLKVALRAAHVALDYTLIGFVALHVLAALKHQFVDRDGLVARMLPFIR